MTQKVLQTYSGRQASQIVGLTRDGFHKAMKRVPLEPDVIHNGVSGWTEQRLKQWYQSVPVQGGHPRTKVVL